VAAAYASATNVSELSDIAYRLKRSDVARWGLSRFAIANTTPMTRFLPRLLKCRRFEEMNIPLCAVATDLAGGRPVIFRDRGDVIEAVRGSCAYPGLFHPVQYAGGFLIDGTFSMEVPAAPLRQMGATKVIAVNLKTKSPGRVPSNAFEVVNRCFAILHNRMEMAWRSECDLVIEPDLGAKEWNCFRSAANLIAAGEEAATAAIRKWFESGPPPVSSLSAKASKKKETMESITSLCVQRGC